uniref:NADH-ubiquinone oxidoreductase chain 1 n=1 Tax=Myadora brevis TaxID=457650 RepID=A0A1U9XPJ2_9BIVA|nr:NADH dehydrogenase subunit 1 [Myadora brevis]AQZ26162.1 NADH dehydrogenase subunit 1 [Myadora brevis]
MSVVVSFLVTYIFILAGVAYFTLLERKGLGYFQRRKGPNKVGFIGVFQPLADALKLFLKEFIIPKRSNKYCFVMAPVFTLMISLLLWHAFPSFYPSTCLGWGILYVLCVSSLNVYGTMISGWSSNSKYALLGAMRAVAQTISYEVSMSLFILFVVILYGSFDLYSISEKSFMVWVLFPPLFFQFLASVLAETNRAPFDLAEGESELVSGFNVEYSGGGFALIFMAEYANILFMSTLVSVLWLGGFSVGSPLLLGVKTLFISFFFIWSRATLPRHRYDLLMALTWKSFLPMALIGLLVVVSFKALASFLLF